MYRGAVAPLVLLALVFVGGGVLGAIVGWTVGRASASRAVRALALRVAPVLERRAIALGIATPSSPSVGVGRDGELTIDSADVVDRVRRTCDAIDEKETPQLGYVDTLRISKEDVEVYMKK